MSFFLALTLAAELAQADAGDLRVSVVDATGGAIAGATVAVESDVSQVRRSLVTDDSGVATAGR